MTNTAYRSALIRKIEQEMDRVDAESLCHWKPSPGYNDMLEGKQEAYNHVLWLIKDTEDL